MSKIRTLKPSPSKIRKITGGKDPVRLLEEFLTKRGFNAEECLQQRSSDMLTWSLSISEEEELEITLEGVSRYPETTLYIGINVMSVPIKQCEAFCAAALTVADTLIGAKLSLVNYDLVLSTTVYTANMGLEDVDYYYELVMRQRGAVQEAVLDELEK
ncbi:MAG: hypothetical protein IT292_06000 [Deltaproteobacteria bacterium]|nr:hypothetical protein [Deltaproteobacteria bacterium]